jgi:hypothetical protein
MPTLSTEPTTPSSRIYLVGITAFFLFVCGLLAYLFTPALPAGDSAAYLDQVGAGDLGQRTLHLGYLVQLSFAAWSLGDAGAPLLSAAWGLLALAMAAWGSAALLTPRQPRWLAIAPPVALLGAAPFWTHTLFPETYGPAAAALLAAAALRLHGRPAAAAVAAGLAVAIHPGSLVWILPLAWIGVDRPRRKLAFVVGALAIPAAVIAAEPADYLAGDRGVFGLLETPRFGLSIQRTYRLLAGAYPLTGALLAVGWLHGATRARFASPALVGVGLTLLIDWRDDVPAALPVVYLSAMLAVPALVLLRDRLGAPAAVTAAITLLALAQVGEATSRHDRARRIAVRQVEMLGELNRWPTPPLAWGSYGERARYQHYVSGARGPAHVALPPGAPFPPGICPEQRTAIAGTRRVFTCAGPPGEPP